MTQSYAGVWQMVNAIQPCRYLTHVTTENLNVTTNNELEMDLEMLKCRKNLILQDGPKGPLNIKKMNLHQKPYHLH